MHWTPCLSSHLVYIYVYLLLEVSCRHYKLFSVLLLYAISKFCASLKIGLCQDGGFDAQNELCESDVRLYGAVFLVGFIKCLL